MADLPPFAAEWLRQREGASRALAERSAAELRALDDAAALAQIEAVLSLPVTYIDEARRVSSGFVEQQRLFRRRR